MVKLETPEWITNPQPGALKCTYVNRAGDAIGEHAVQFVVSGRTYTSFILAEDIDFDRELMRVSVIGSLKDGSYLISLPRDTLTSGTSMKIQKDAPELVYDPQ